LGTPLAIPHRRCWPSWPDLGERWPSRLVATAAEERLKHQAQICTHRLRQPAIAEQAKDLVATSTFALAQPAADGA
jgi:hypothetical protein